MGALVNVFKSLFGGILGFLGGLLGGKKDQAAPAKKAKRGKDGFFMEADAASMEELPVAAPAAVAAAVEAAPAVKGKGKKEKTAVKAAPAKAPAAPRVMTAEELIVAAVQPKAAETVAAATGGTAGFATQYMVPTLTSGRRSPGPSLKGFKAMAKEIRG